MFLSVIKWECYCLLPLVAKSCFVKIVCVSVNVYLSHNNCLWWCKLSYSIQAFRIRPCVQFSAPKQCVTYGSNEMRWWDECWVHNSEKLKKTFVALARTGKRESPLFSLISMLLLFHHFHFFLRWLLSESGWMWNSCLEQI